MCKSLDEHVEDFRSRPLEGSYPFLWLDATVVKSREGGRIVNVSVVAAIAVHEQGHREILGLDVVTTEDGAGWLAFLRSLISRGLSGVMCVTSDAHSGLRDAIEATLPGASWQRCRTHFMTNLLTSVSKAAQDGVATLVRSIFAQPDAASVTKQCRHVATDEADNGRAVGEDTDDVSASLDLLIEQNDEWAIARRYMSVGALECVQQLALTTRRGRHGLLDQICFQTVLGKTAKARMSGSASSSLFIASGKLSCSFAAKVPLPETEELIVAPV